MAEDKLQDPSKGTTFKPEKKKWYLPGDSDVDKKKFHDMTSATKRDMHKTGQGKRHRAATFVDKKTGTTVLDTPKNRKTYGKRVYKAPDVDYKAKGGRAGYQDGGRTNLLEELGRVEGESSNRNRRAEVSRIHGELNRGYSKGGRTGLKHGGAAKRGRGCEIKS
tara:strand:- start:56 stop:547 length:492 start_codon:yes stop_codon:yes gene_type:complete